MAKYMKTLILLSFDGLGKSLPAFSSERNSKKDNSPSSLNKSISWRGDEKPLDKSTGMSRKRHSQNNIPVENGQEFPQPLSYMSTFSSDYNKSVRQRSTSPPYENVAIRQSNI